MGASGDEIASIGRLLTERWAFIGAVGRIEHDYMELKQEVGLGDFEGEDGAGSTITPRCQSRFMDS
jgi:hypothetical protein